MKNVLQLFKNWLILIEQGRGKEHVISIVYTEPGTFFSFAPSD